MRVITIALAACLLMSGGAATASGGGGKSKPKGPAGIPYVCSDGQPLRVVYDGGGARGTARLMLSTNAYDMAAAATINGLRYASDHGLTDRHSLVWATDGVTGVLSEVPAGQAGVGEEREITRCARFGRDGATEPAAETHSAEAHADDAHH